MNVENTSDDVIVEEEVSGEGVTDNQVTDDGVTVEDNAEDTVVEPDQQQTEPKRDDYWKNRTFELERKLNNLSESLPNIIAEESKKVQTQQEEHSIEQLEQYMESHPEHKAWARAKIRELETKQIVSELNKTQQQALEAQKQERIRQDSFKQVVSDPVYSEAFVTLSDGSKSWNPDSILARTANDILSDPRIKSQPDALSIAMDIAYARLAKSNQLENKSRLESLKRQNAKLKTKTIVEGGGVKIQPIQKDSFSIAKERLARTGSSSDAHQAVAEYFKKIRG